MQAPPGLAPRRAAFCPRGLALWAVLLAVGSAPPAAGEPGLRYNLRRYSVEHGLVQSQIYAMHQDREGYLWIGTEGGASRFDGRTFVTLSTGFGMPGTKVNAITEDGAGRLWFGTGGGLTIFWGGSFRTILDRERTGPQGVRSVLATRRGEVWAATERGPFLCTGDGRCARVEAPGSQLGAAAVTCLVESADGVVWMGTARAGVFRYDRSSDQGVRISEGLPNGAVLSLAEDRNGRLWAGTVGGIRTLEEGRFVVPSAAAGLSIGMVFAVLDDPDHGLLLGTDRGLVRLHGEPPNLWPWQAETIGSRVQSLLRDREGNLWIGAWGAGLYQFRGDALTHVDASSGLPHPVVMSFAEDRTGDVWLGTEAGVARVDAAGALHLVPGDALRGQVARAMLRTRDGKIWIGSNLGLARHDGRQLHAVSRRDGLPDPEVIAIAEDRDGRLWVGARDGLVRVEEARSGTPRFGPRMAIGRVNAVHCDATGRVWLGTARGLRVLEGDAPTVPEGAGGILAEVPVLAITEDDRGGLWLGTYGSGVARFVPPAPGRPARVDRLTSAEGLSSDLVYFLLFDGSNLWIGTQLGVDRLAGARLDGPGGPSLRTYDGSAGYVGVESNHGAALRARDGSLWFGTVGGAVRLDPRRERPNRIEPRTRIERLELFRTPTDWATRGVETRDGLPIGLRLAPDDNHLTFAFHGLSLTAPESVRYQYRLRGVDRDWSQASPTTSVTYPALAPGDYTFEVKACNESGLCNQQSVASSFSIRPPWWATAPFQLLAAVSLLGSIYGVGWLFERRVRQRTRELREEIAERQRVEAEVERIHRELLEASHQAGMAEIATNVLHNVGNVLNSINVSAELVAESLRQARLAGLLQVVGLLQEHEHDVGDFLSNDPKGSRIPAYLAELSARLAGDRAKGLVELELLRRSIEHIKEIVAMQQSYARVAGVVERVAVAGLVEDSLRINAGALSRHGVETVSEIDAVPPVSVEKHKVLQVLVNLLRNAKHACEESGRADKRVTVRVTNGGDRIRIAIVDNGVGIPAENLTRIFQHGFTTRASGHGFGLHASAIAAQEMGGTLVAASDGPGTGACFTLELPLSPPAEPCAIGC